MTPSSRKTTSADHRMIGGMHGDGDGDGDSDGHDDNGAARNENLLPRSVCDTQCASLPLRMRKKSIKKKKKGVSVATKNGSFTRRPVDLMCSQFPSGNNGAVSVDVSCGAMNAFSNDVPYNSAGLSLARSIDTNPGGFLSQNSRRRRRPTISSLTSSPPISSNNNSTIRRRLMTSAINIPTSSRRRTFGSSSPGVERFNYAKALLQSDHELEKLSRKIRSEINESELFELAQAAEKAADLGVNNFSGRASTFGGELHNQRQEELTSTKTGLPVIGNWKPLIGDDTTTHSALAQAPRVSRTKPQNSKETEDNVSGIDDGGRSPVGFPEQSLLEHARAAAAAVVVLTPAMQLHATTLRVQQIRKEPERRSMDIKSLRDVNEVIPQWKELHGHMRTHFYRANVKTTSLFFCEVESAPILSTWSSSSIQAKENKRTTNHRRTKSFFDNIANIKLLRDFRPKKSPQQRAINSQSDDDINEFKERKIRKPNTVGVCEFGIILSSHISPKNKEFDEMQSPVLRAPPGLTHPDEFKNHNCEPLIEGATTKIEISDDQQNQTTSLAPRFPRRSESFDKKVLHIAKVNPASPQRPIGSQDIEEDDDSDHSGAIQSSKNSALGSPPIYQDGSIQLQLESIVSSPKGNKEFSMALPDYESACPVSPSNEPSLHKLNPQFVGPPSPTAPSTPNNSVIPRRKDSGFSTPAHLRMIKRLHGSVSDEKRSINKDCSEQSKLEDLQGFEFQDEAYSTTPGTGVYSHFEPNSIVQNSPERSTHILTSLQYVERTHLSLPTIQSSKSENDLQTISRNFIQRKVRTQRQNDSIFPPDSSATFTGSMSKSVSSKGVEGIAFACDTPFFSSAKRELGANCSKKNQAEKYITSDDSKTLSSSKLMNCINPPHDAISLDKVLTSTIQDNLNGNSIQQNHFGKAVDEKKECDGITSNVNTNPHDEKDEVQSINNEHQQYILNIFPLRNEKKEGNVRMQRYSSTCIEDKAPFPYQKTNGDSGCSPICENESTIALRKRGEKSELIPTSKSWEKESLATTKSIEKTDSNHTAEPRDFLSTNSTQRDDEINGRKNPGNASNGDNSSVCHSLASTDVTFKTAVQTVQGVAVQTVQEVFSHLSLGNPRNRLKSKEWQSEVDNKEFLSNYFYCAKTLKLDKSRYASAIRDNVEKFDPSETDGEGLACTEPCNGRDSPCYLFGIDSMCGGLIDLLPHDVNVNSLTRNQRKEGENGVLSDTTTRDRASSISMDQIHQSRRHLHSGMNSYQDHNKGTWLDLFQRVASKRFNFQFQTEENDLEKSRHPYTPPCLSRKVPTSNHTL